jgi:FKBP-type peptidyl-prolyl cis-trans isomerase 2
MMIEPFCRVRMNYKLSLADGEVIEDSAESGPIELVYGQGSVIPGLERALEGMQPGEAKQVVIAPEDGYGERDDEAVIMVPRDNFPQDQKLEPGMVFSLRRQDGHVIYARLLEIHDQELKMDFNHPLAGQTLTFDIKIEDVLEPDPNAASCSCGCGGPEHEDDCGPDCGPGCGGGCG